MELILCRYYNRNHLQIGLNTTMQNALFFVFCLLGPVPGFCAEKQPHIIFFLVDDMGWNDVSYHGMNEIYTPNIDTLAAAGVLLNNYYVQPVCTPSRGALMTGIYPIRTGLQHLVFFDSYGDALPLKYTLLPERLKQKGYVTRMIGKWHLGFFWRNHTPTYRGFDSHYGYWTGSTDYFQKTSSEILMGNMIINRPSLIPKTDAEVFAGIDFRDNLQPLRINPREYVTDLFTERAKDIITTHDQSKPLFLYLAHLAVHRGDSLLPIRTPEKYTSTYRYISDKSRRNFAGKLKAVDLSLGTVMESLYQAKMLQDTIIIFSSDNGAALHGPWATSGSNWPLRSEKNTNFEGGIRVPGFVWSPRLKNLPRTSDQMIHMVDWLPTLYHAAGGDAKDLGQIDGMDMWPTIAEEKPSPRTGFLINIDSIDNTSGIREGDWKLVRMNSSHNPNLWYGPTGKQKGPFGYPQTSTVLNVLKRFYKNNRLRFSGRNRTPLSCGSTRQPSASVTTSAMCADTQPCLFNVVDDPCEYKDLSKQFPEKVAELEQKIREFQTVPPMAGPSDFKSAPMLHCGYWDSWLDQANRKSVEFCHQQGAL